MDCVFEDKNTRQKFIKLRNPADWTSWFGWIQTRAIVGGVWKYIDPSGTEVPTKPVLHVPELRNFEWPIPSISEPQSNSKLEGEKIGNAEDEQVQTQGPPLPAVTPNVDELIATPEGYLTILKRLIELQGDDRYDTELIGLLINELMNWEDSRECHFEIWESRNEAHLEALERIKGIGILIKKTILRPQWSKIRRKRSVRNQFKWLFENFKPPPYLEQDYARQRYEKILQRRPVRCEAIVDWTIDFQLAFGRMRDLGMTLYTNYIGLKDFLAAIRERHPLWWEMIQLDIIKRQRDGRELPKLEDELKDYREYTYRVEK